MSLKLKSLGFVTVAAAGTAVPLSATSLIANFVRIQPRKNKTTENAGNVYLITNSTGNNTQPTTMYAILAQEQNEGLELPFIKEEQWDLSQIFLDADTNGDGVLVGYN